MATPIVAWGVTSQSSAVSSGDAVPVAPAAGDLVFVSITVANDSGSPPTVTPASGWEIVDNQTFTVYGAYPSRNVLMKKVIGSSEASNLGSTYTTNANLLTTTDAWGVRGCDPASMTIAVTANTTDSNLMFADASSSTGALIIRLATNHTPNPGFWADVGPSGHTRINNKKSVEPNTGLYYKTSTGSTAGPAGPVTLANGGTVIPTFSYTISLADSSGPDVTPPTITSSATLSIMEGNTLSHALTADETVTWSISGGADAAAFTLTGSTLSLPAQTYPSGPLVVVVRATDAAGNWTEQTITVTITEGPVVQVVGYTSGTTSAGAVAGTLPGDIQIALAYRDGSNTLPTLAAGWTELNSTAGASTNSSRLCHRVAGASNTGSGTFTSSTTTALITLRPKAGYTLSVGASAAPQTGATNTLTYGTLALQGAINRVFGFVGHRSVNTTIESPPTGMENLFSVLDGTDEVAVHATPGSVSSWPSTTKTITGTASGWRTHVLEIVATPEGLPTITGTASGALSALSALSAAAPSVTGAAARSLAPGALSSAGSVSITASASSLVGALTLAAIGEVGFTTIEGVASLDLSSLAVIAAGAPQTAGQASTAISGLTVSAQGSLAASGALSGLLAPLSAEGDGSAPVSGAAQGVFAASAASEGAVSIDGGAGASIAPLSLLSFGAAGLAPIDGAAFLLLDVVSALASGAPSVTGAAAASASFSASASGSALINGAGAGAVGAVAASAGSVSVAGVASAGVGAEAEAEGEPYIDAAASLALAGLLAASEGEPSVTGAVMAQIEPLMLTAEGTVRNLRIGRRLVIVVG